MNKGVTKIRALEFVQNLFHSVSFDSNQQQGGGGGGEHKFRQSLGIGFSLDLGNYSNTCYL